MCMWGAIVVFFKCPLVGQCVCYFVFIDALVCLHFVCMDCVWAVDLYRMQCISFLFVSCMSQYVKPIMHTTNPCGLKKIRLHQPKGWCVHPLSQVTQETQGYGGCPRVLISLAQHVGYGYEQFVFFFFSREMIRDANQGGGEVALLKTSTPPFKL